MAQVVSSRQTPPFANPALLNRGRSPYPPPNTIAPAYNNTFPLSVQSQPNPPQSNNNLLPPYTFKTINNNTSTAQEGDDIQVYNYRQSITSPNNGTVQSEKGVDTPSFTPKMNQKRDTFISTLTVENIKELKRDESRQDKNFNYEEYFSKYAKANGLKNQQKSQLDSQKNQNLYGDFYKTEKPKSSESYMTNYYESMVEPSFRAANKKQTNFSSENVSYTDMNNYKKQSSLNTEFNRQVPFTADFKKQSTYSVDPKSENTTFKGESKASTNLFPSQQQLQNEQLRKKIAELTKQLTKLSVDKSDLIVQVADLNRLNHTLKKDNDRLRQENELKESAIFKLKQEPIKPKQPQGIVIDPSILIQIQEIQQRQMEIGKLKKEFLQLLETKYGEEMKRLADLNNVLKLQLHNAKFELSLARQNKKQQTLKYDLLLKQQQAYEASATSQARAIREKIQVELNQKNQEISALKCQVASMETHYKAQKKQIADKDDFIRKYMAAITGQDSQAIQLLIDKYNFYSRKEFQAQARQRK